MKHSLIAFCLLFAVGCQSGGGASLLTEPSPTRVAIDVDELSQIRRGLNHLYFENWDGARVPVWVYVPSSVDVKTAPVLIMMHGAKRGAARYLSEWDLVADKEGFIVIAPEFTREDYPGSAGYNLGNRIPRGSDAVIEEDLWTFSAIEPIFDHIVQQLGGTQTHYTLYGHSAGAQFTHRFMYFKPDARAKRFIAANAGWYTFPDLEIDYPVGLVGLGLSDDRLRAYLKKDLVIVLGDQDSDPNHESLKRDDGVDEQGPHRFARGQNFYATGKAEAERLGSAFGWRLRIVEGVAHSNAGIAAASGDLVR